MKKPSAILSLAALACASAADPILYTPTRSLPDQGIQLSSWGSGSIGEADELAYEGTSSIRISSRNFFQGGIMKFGRPVALGDAFGDRENLLLLTFQVPGTRTQLGGVGGGPAGFLGPAGFGGPAGAGGFGGPAGAGGFGGPAGAPGPGGAGGFGGFSSQAPAGDLPVDEIRLVLTMTDGRKAEVFLKLDSNLVDNRGWRTIGVPLQAISGLGSTNKTVASVAMSLDRPATIYVGDLKILTDSTPVYAEPMIRELNLSFGQEVILYGNGTGGATPLRYTWDFDDADGVGVDAEGQAVRRRFLKPGSYTVTMTVQDIFGLKEQHRSTIKVVVNP
jgi:hypothetical protein